MRNILVIEDEKKMSAFIQQGLEEAGHSVKTADSPSQARRLLLENKFDLIILDIMLPELSGFDFSKELRLLTPTSLILMVTALSTTKDKIQGLDSGADDYLTKPFDLEELHARVRALLRRNSTDKASLQNGQLEMNLLTRQVIREGMRIELTTKEFSLLEFLMRNIDKVQDRNSIARQVWGADFDPDSNVIDVYINHLRKKIDSPYSKKILKTVVGQGYVLNKME
jgi:two-component system copper resistance phosphate regulon response regulator CusR